MKCHLRVCECVCDALSDVTVVWVYSTALGTEGSGGGGGGGWTVKLLDTYLQLVICDYTVKKWGSFRDDL